MSHRAKSILGNHKTRENSLVLNKQILKEHLEKTPEIPKRNAGSFMSVNNSIEKFASNQPIKTPHSVHNSVHKMRSTSNRFNEPLTDFI